MMMSCMSHDLDEVRAIEIKTIFSGGGEVMNDVLVVKESTCFYSIALFYIYSILYLFR